MSNKTTFSELFGAAVKHLQSLDKEELAGRAVDGFVSFMDNLAELGKSLQTAADWVAVNIGGEGADITDDDAEPFQPVTHAALMETLDSIRAKDPWIGNEKACSPSCPGWAVFDSSVYGPEVELCGECMRFVDDADALWCAVDLLRKVYP